MPTWISTIFADPTSATLGCVALVEATGLVWLVHRLRTLQRRLHIAIEAAEDAARAAALAAPGGIDPEVVINLLRSGRPVTLDIVNNLADQATASSTVLKTPAI